MGDLTHNLTLINPIIYEVNDLIKSIIAPNKPGVKIIRSKPKIGPTNEIRTYDIFIYLTIIFIFNLKVFMMEDDS